jgi:hypothetical protein
MGASPRLVRAVAARDRDAGLRIIHAVWHLGCVEGVAPALRVSRAREVAHDDHADLPNHVVLASPFVGQGLHEGLSMGRWPGNEDSAHEILLKGYELPAASKFTDSDGKERDVVRAVWWNDPDAPVPRDRTTVFGHYWNVPPTDSEHPVAPPFASGHPELARWQKERRCRHPIRGRWTSATTRSSCASATTACSMQAVAAASARTAGRSIKSPRRVEAERTQLSAPTYLNHECGDRLAAFDMGYRSSSFEAAPPSCAA